MFEIIFYEHGKCMNRSSYKKNVDNIKSIEGKIDSEFILLLFLKCFKYTHNFFFFASFFLAITFVLHKFEHICHRFHTKINEEAKNDNETFDN